MRKPEVWINSGGKWPRDGEGISKVRNQITKEHFVSLLSMLCAFFFLMRLRTYLCLFLLTFLHKFCSPVSNPRERISASQLSSQVFTFSVHQCQSLVFFVVFYVLVKKKPLCIWFFFPVFVKILLNFKSVKPCRMLQTMLTWRKRRPYTHLRFIPLNEDWMFVFLFYLQRTSPCLHLHSSLRLTAYSVCLWMAPQS